MAYRRPFQDLSQMNLEDSSDNEDPLYTAKVIELSPRKISTNKIHPASTNFSLDTFSEYLQNELKQRRSRQERLRSNPSLAAAEAEKERLYKLVNSNKPIEARVRNGRLEVRGAVRARSFSVPASEGDSESQSCRGHGGFGSGSSRGNPVEKIKSWAPRKRKSMSNDNTSSLTSAISQPPRNRIELIEEQNLDLFCWDKDVSGDSSSPAQSSMSRLQQPRTLLSQTTDTVTSSASVPRKFSRTALQKPQREAHWRSLSFERHAEGVRNSGRPSKESTIQQPSSQETLVASSSSSSKHNVPQPTKLATGQTNFASSPTAPMLKVSSLPTFGVADAGELSAWIGTLSPKSTGVDKQILATTREVATDDEWMVLDQESRLDTISAKGKSTSSKKIGSRPSARVPEVLRRSCTARRVLTGRDTFFTASSDDLSDAPSDGEDTDESVYDRNCATTERSEIHQIVKDENDGCCSVSKFDYKDIIPEALPADIRQARENCAKIWSQVGLDGEGQLDSTKSALWFSTQYSIDELSPSSHNILGACDPSGVYPRKWKAIDLPTRTKDPPHCFPLSRKAEFPEEALPLICQYLSSQEVRNLRLVNRATASALLPLMVRSTVVNFGPSLFGGTDGSDWNCKSNSPALNSLTRSYGDSINKFGISFDFDPNGLASAETKTIEEEVDAWFGRYVWPKATYPRFSQLREMEDLVDVNRPLLRNAMKTLVNVSELAISIDSGHGWLVGPDTSDLALFKQRQQGGSKVFGKTFSAPDKWNEFALRQYFNMGQRNTLNAYKKLLVGTKDAATFTKLDRKILRRFQIRDYDDYEVQSEQPDFNRGAHTGHTMSPMTQQHGAQGTTASMALSATQAFVAPPLLQVQAAPMSWTTAIHHQIPGNPNQPNPFGHAVPSMFAGGPPLVSTTGLFPPTPAQSAPLAPLLNQQPPLRPTRARQQRRQAKETESQGRPILPQWPLIFSGYNLAAQMGGNQNIVQDEVSSPANFAYLPGVLTEAQVQWLMETLWAQRAFLSAYTNSIITNVGAFRNVHSFHVAKLSSGLISSLAQAEFWSSLPNLKKLTLKVIPDWRQEHIPGDKFYHRNMPISPVQASVKLAYLLENFIANIENLSTLRVGFVGGGEHQTGMFGRNRHVVPAPVTSCPLDWLTDHEVKPDPRTMFAFNHIRDLTFENCWFSPCMLESFMRKSRDTSLHHLILDSVSMTGVYDTRNDGPLSTEGHTLRCEFSPSEWLQESIPQGACWVNVLENITPGKTILERKYEAEMIDESIAPQPDPVFRGNIKKITLKSCGYVRIMGTRSDRFSQNGLVDQSNPWCSLDSGLEARRKTFYINNSQESFTEPYDLNHPRTSFLRRGVEDDSKEMPKVCIMMSNRDPESRNENLGLGKLTQCVHPVEKRILERAWGLRFGWSDDMERWAAVEDGWFEGGTGRFSGVVVRDDES